VEIEGVADSEIILARLRTMIMRQHETFDSLSTLHPTRQFEAKVG